MEQPIAASHGDPWQNHDRFHEPDHLPTRAEAAFSGDAHPLATEQPIAHPKQSRQPSDSGYAHSFPAETPANELPGAFPISAYPTPINEKSYEQSQYARPSLPAERYPSGLVDDGGSRRLGDNDASGLDATSRQLPAANASQYATSNNILRPDLPADDGASTASIKSGVVGREPKSMVISSTYMPNSSLVGEVPTQSGIASQSDMTTSDTGYLHESTTYTVRSFTLRGLAKADEPYQSELLPLISDTQAAPVSGLPRDTAAQSLSEIYPSQSHPHGHDTTFQGASLVEPWEGHDVNDVSPLGSSYVSPYSGKALDPRVDGLGAENLGAGAVSADSSVDFSRGEQAFEKQQQTEPVVTGRAGHHAEAADTLEGESHAGRNVALGATGTSAAAAAYLHHKRQAEKAEELMKEQRAHEAESRYQHQEQRRQAKRLEKREKVLKKSEGEPERRGSLLGFLHRDKDKYADDRAPVEERNGRHSQDQEVGVGLATGNEYEPHDQTQQSPARSVESDGKGSSPRRRSGVLGSIFHRKEKDRPSSEDSHEEPQHQATETEAVDATHSGGTIGHGHTKHGRNRLHKSPPAGYAHHFNAQSDDHQEQGISDLAGEAPVRNEQAGFRVGRSDAHPPAAMDPKHEYEMVPEPPDELAVNAEKQGEEVNRRGEGNGLTGAQVHPVPPTVRSDQSSADGSPKAGVNQGN